MDGVFLTRLMRGWQARVSGRYQRRFREAFPEAGQDRSPSTWVVPDEDGPRLMRWANRIGVEEDRRRARPAWEYVELEQQVSQLEQLAEQGQWWDCLARECRQHGAENHPDLERRMVTAQRAAAATARRLELLAPLRAFERACDAGYLDTRLFAACRDIGFADHPDLRLRFTAAQECLRQHRERRAYAIYAGAASRSPTACRALVLSAHAPEVSDVLRHPGDQGLITITAVGPAAAALLWPGGQSKGPAVRDVCWRRASEAEAADFLRTWPDLHDQPLLEPVHLPLMHLHHLALDTHENWRSTSAEVLPDVIADLRLMLDQAVVSAAEHPWEPGYTIQARQQGRCLICTVAGPTGRLVTFAVAGRRRCGEIVWKEILGDRGYPANPNRQPETPWCASRLELGCQTDRRAMSWMQDFIKCVAWAWLTRPASGPGAVVSRIGGIE